jgi:hypothetical protein
LYTLTRGVAVDEVVEPHEPEVVEVGVRGEHVDGWSRWRQVLAAAAEVEAGAHAGAAPSWVPMTWAEWRQRSAKRMR